MINTINKYINKYVNQITAISGILIALGIVFIVTGYESYKDLALIGATIIGIIPIAIRAFQALRMKVFSIELLVTIAVVGALYLNEFVESSVVSFLFLFGATYRTKVYYTICYHSANVNSYKLIATKILLFLSLTDLGCLAPFDLLSFNNSVSHGARHPFLLQMSIPTSCNNNHNTLLFLSLTDSFVRIGFVRKEDIRWQSVQFAERELMLA